MRFLSVSASFFGEKLWNRTSTIPRQTPLSRSPISIPKITAPKAILTYTAASRAPIPAFPSSIPPRNSMRAASSSSCLPSRAARTLLSADAAWKTRSALPTPTARTLSKPTWASHRASIRATAASSTRQALPPRNFPARSPSASTAIPIVPTVTFTAAAAAHSRRRAASK